MMYQWGNYEPDTRDAQSMSLVKASGLAPGPGDIGYRSLLKLTAYSQNTLDARARGLITTTDRFGNATTYAGDETKLYELLSRNWENRSRTAGYSLGAQERWEFATLFDNVYATTRSQPLQGKEKSNSSALYEDWITSTAKPQGAHMAVSGSFLMLGNILYPQDSGGIVDRPTRVWWSAIGNPQDFDPSPSTQAGFQDLTGADPGRIMKVVGGEYFTIFGRNTIHRADYVGPSVIFQITEIEPARGCLASGSVVSVGRRHFYLSDEGFYVQDGQDSAPIGEGRINNTFFGELDQSNIDRITAARDPDDTIVYWLYPGSGNTDGQPNRKLAYNWAYDRWTETEIDTLEHLAYAATEATTLEDLDALFPTLEDVTPSMDSNVWKGGEPQFGAFDNQNRLGFFQGGPLPFVIETGDRFFDNPYRIKGDRFRPVIEAFPGSSPSEPVAKLQIGRRENLTDDITWGSVIDINRFGEFRQRFSGRYVRLRLISDVGTRNTSGIEVEPKRAGRR